MPFPRPCDNCGKKFTPYSQVTKLCSDCMDKSYKAKRIPSRGKKHTTYLKTMIESLK